MSRYDAGWHRRLRSIIAELPFRTQTERIAMRRALASDPVAFAILYLSHHLKDSTGRVTFSEVHYEWARIAESWRGSDEPQGNRHAFIAPRETGKSTWWFLILPLWAAANDVRRFAVAFAHADSQATGHLATFKRELDTNALLRADFPELCEPARKQTGTTLADRQGMLHTQSGFVFAARGVDTASLGLKVGEVRPDLLIFDDIEPDEARYSPDLAEKRKGTITDALLPLNFRAAVAMVGTVTMPGSIMHQMVRVAHGSTDDELKWIRDEKIVPHHHVPIVEDADGTEHSMWPEKWPLSFLLSIRHTRSFAKNYLNDPMGRDGDYWTSDDFRYGTLGAEATRWMLQLDPAVTTKRSSDYTGWAVVAYRPSRSVNIGGKTVQTKPVAEVVASGKIRLVGEALRGFVLAKLAEYERIKAVRIEVNQGGELWHTVLHHLPATLLVHTSNESKEVRFAYALDLYQRGHVLHRQRMRDLEEQMVSFPKAPYDDVADAAVCGILYFLSDVPRIATSVQSATYV